MKKLILLFMATLLFLSGCGIPTDTTIRDETSDTPQTNIPDEGNSEVAEQIKINGLDSLVGITQNDTLTVPVLEDTYVEGGNSANKNFGSSEMLDFKALNADEPQKYESYYRTPLLKFDVSSLPQDEIISVTLTLDCFVLETPGYFTEVLVYGCDPSAWEESKVTYATRPEKEDFVKSVFVSGKGLVNIDVTDYVLKCLSFKDSEISFILEGDYGSIKRLNFSSKERQDGRSAFLNVTCGDYAYTTDIAYDGENPWTLAMQNVSDWLERWETIKKGGDSDTQTVVKRESEYSVTTDACLTVGTAGYNTRYTSHPTRLVSTLDGYVPDFSETAEYDVYGGLVNDALKQEATGYFYAKKIGDRWWAIDPLGYPFYRTACVAITHGDSQNHKALTLSKYENVGNWAQAATERLRALGFNSAGNWSDIANLINADKPLSQTERWNIMSTYATSVGIKLPTPGDTKYSENVMPVFDPEFVVSALKSTAEKTKGYAGAPEVFGWFSDNELPSEINTLDFSLKKDPSDPKWGHTYATAWTFMYMKTGKANVSLADITDEFRLEYRAMVYDKYFSVAKLCLDKYVPMHQYFGSRFTPGCYLDEYIVRVAGYYCDVISLNYYGAWDAKASVVENLQKWSGRPFAVTEWYAKGMDTWEIDNRMTNVSGAGWTVRTQADRGRFYQNYALSLLECKGCVGFDWFQYWDNDPDNLSADPSNRNANKGIMSNSCEEYTELTDYMAELNNQKYNLIKYFDAR